CTEPPAAKAISGAKSSATRIFFMLSIPLHRDPIRRRPELVDLRVPRHQQEEAEVDQAAQLRDLLAPVRRRLRAEIAEDEEGDHEQRQEGLVDRAAVADRLDRAAVEPGQ